MKKCKLHLKIRKHGNPVCVTHLLLWTVSTWVGLLSDSSAKEQLALQSQPAEEPCPENWSSGEISQRVWMPQVLHLWFLEPSGTNEALYRQCSPTCSTYLSTKEIRQVTVPRIPVWFTFSLWHRQALLCHLGCVCLCDCITKSSQHDVSCGTSK